MIKKLLDSRATKIDTKYVTKCNNYKRTYFKTDYINGAYKWHWYDENGYEVKYDSDGYAMDRNTNGTYTKMSKRDKHYIDEV